jgi:hypothetical protein
VTLGLILTVLSAGVSGLIASLILCFESLLIESFTGYACGIIIHKTNNFHGVNFMATEVALKAFTRASR